MIEIIRALHGTRGLPQNSAMVGVRLLGVCLALCGAPAAGLAVGPRVAIDVGHSLESPGATGAPDCFDPGGRVR